MPNYRKNSQWQVTSNKLPKTVPPEKINKVAEHLKQFNEKRKTQIAKNVAERALKNAKEFEKKRTEFISPNCTTLNM